MYHVDHSGGGQSSETLIKIIYDARHELAKFSTLTTSGTGECAVNMNDA